MTIEDKMRVALQTAEEGLLKGELPIGAAAFLGDKLLYTTHTSEKEDKRFLVHAEQKVLLAVDKMDLTYSERKKVELYTNLEPCMMCLGTAIASFIGSVYYGIESKTDGAVNWAVKSWDEIHDKSSFTLPYVESGVLKNESIDLFKRYIETYEDGVMVEWAKTLI